MYYIKKTLLATVLSMSLIAPVKSKANGWTALSGIIVGAAIGKMINDWRNPPTHSYTRSTSYVTKSTGSSYVPDDTSSATNDVPKEHFVIYEGKLINIKKLPHDIINTGFRDAAQIVYIEKKQLELDKLFTDNHTSYLLTARAAWGVIKQVNIQGEMACMAYCGGFNSKGELQSEYLIQDGLSKSEIFQKISTQCQKKSAILFREFRRQKLRSGQLVAQTVPATESSLICVNNEKQQLLNQDNQDVLVKKSATFGQLYSQDKTKTGLK